MLAVRLTAPGVPDLYQGTEALRYLLVDPDNRVAARPRRARHARRSAPATLDGRAAWSEPGAPAARAVVLRRLLAARPRARWSGTPPLTPDEHLVAFARLDAAGEPAAVTIVPRVAARPAGIEVALPPGEWHHVLLDDEPAARRSLPSTRRSTRSPAIVLVRARSSSTAP